MKIILCLIGKELLTENEKYILQYDTEDIRIDLYTDVISMGISEGRIKALYDLVCVEGPICLCTDVESIYEKAQYMYKDLFCDIKLCPVLCEEEKYKTYSGKVRKEIFREIFFDLQDLKLYCEKASYGDSYAEIYAFYTYIDRKLSACTKEELEFFYQWLEDYSYPLNDNQHLFYYFCLTVLLNVKKEKKYIELLYSEIQNECYSIDNYFNLFHQLKRFLLKYPYVGGNEILECLYQQILIVWKEACKEYLAPIPCSVRNKNRTVIIVLQFLGKGNAPTKTALERIETIGKELGHEVIVFHSAEQLSRCGELPFWEGMVGNIEHIYDGMHLIEKNENFKFKMYQPTVVMPSYGEMCKIINAIRGYLPYRVVMLGDHCLMGDLVAEMIPTVCIPMTFSTLTPKKNQFFAVGKHLTDEDYEKIINMGCDPEYYIESTFTFELIQQTTKLSRKELGIPEDKFVISIVGIRLDYEVTEEFIYGIREIFEHNCHIAFAGNFENYGNICARIPFLKENSTFVGYQDDILAFEEICDLYVNPPRVGGGFSVVEAFYKGKPGVTLAYGDVAASSGPEFWVKDLKEMEKMIIRYSEDEVFYREQVQKALCRSMELFDGKGAMQHILDEMEHRKGFF